MQEQLLEISVEYCAPCGYAPRVVELTEQILGERALEHKIASWRLIPSSGGCFEVMVNGELVFSKKALKRHAEPGEVRAAILTVLNEMGVPEDTAPGGLINPS